MFINKKNGDVVSIIRESSSGNVLVKSIRNNKKYLVEKENLKEVPTK